MPFGEPAGCEAGDWLELKSDADSGPYPIGSVGLIALAEDQAVFEEVRLFLAEDEIGVHTTRLAMPGRLTLDVFAAMGTPLREAVDELPESVDVVAFACTSAAVAMGSERIADIVHAVRPDRVVVDPVASIVCNLRASGLSRVALLTPYASETHEALIALLGESGIQVTAGGRLSRPAGTWPSQITPRSIVKGTKAIDLDEAEGFVIACTALRTASIRGILQDVLGVPVITSNSALARACGVAIGEGSERDACVGL